MKKVKQAYHIQEAALTLHSAPKLVIQLKDKYVFRLLNHSAPIVVCCIEKLKIRNMHAVMVYMKN
jgi:hypothetical protein